MSGRQGISEGELLWEPSAEVAANARVARFVGWLGERGVPIGSYEDLWRWSVTDVDAFWETIWTYFEVVGERGDGPVREGGPTPVDGLRWFPSATLNYAANALRHAQADPDGTAVVFRSESGEHRALGGRELCLQVAAVRTGLAGLGVGKGDRVAAYLPSIPEALICFLATASLGAVWSSCSPDFGSSSVVDRFAQIEPKVLLAVDGAAPTCAPALSGRARCCRCPRESSSAAAWARRWRRSVTTASPW
ncbi:AMP-binding protein [Actinomadura sp. NTSP31]|uniref:AMP-binding protein n=1 Tax=Actinomadura sp. NTSP31 TaxID=1735447 RepID=UPI0035C1B51F